MLLKYFLPTVLICTIMYGVSAQKLLEPYRVSVDRVKAVQYFNQADTLALKADMYMDIFRDAPEMNVFCDLNSDGFTDLMVAQMMMGLNHYYFFPGRTSDSLGAPSFIAGSIDSLFFKHQSSRPEMHVSVYPCCGGVTFVKVLYKSYLNNNEWLIQCDTVIEYYDEFSQYLQPNIPLSEITLSSNDVPLLLTLQNDSELAPEVSYYNRFQSGQKLMVPTPVEKFLKGDYCPVFVYRTPEQFRMPDDSVQWNVLFGWIHKEYIPR